MDCRVPTDSYVLFEWNIKTGSENETKHTFQPVNNQDTCKKRGDSLSSTKH